MGTRKSCTRNDYDPLNDPGIDIFAYDEWYLGDDKYLLALRARAQTGWARILGAGFARNLVFPKHEHPMIPDDAIILASTRARTVRAYGAIQDVRAIESGSVEAQYYPKSWVEEDPSARMVMIQTAPLVIPIQIDAFLSVRGAVGATS